MARRPALFVVALVAFLAGVVLFKASARITPYGEDLTFTIEIEPADVTVNKAKKTDGRPAFTLSVSGYETLLDEGAPEIPYRIVNVLLPQGEAVGSARFEQAEEVFLIEASGIKLSAPQVSEEGVRGDGPRLAGSYNTDEIYPRTLGRYLGTGYLHGRAIASFAVFPIRVVDGEVRVIKRIELKLETEPADLSGVIKRERYIPGFEERVRDILDGYVINPDEDASYDFQQVVVPEPRGFNPEGYPVLDGSAVEYVIITNEELKDEFQRLADWRTAQGIPTVVRTVEWIAANTRNGSDLPETIRFFIQDAYAKWGVTYVLLGGDTDVVPPRYALSRFYQGGTELPADLYFSCLDGSWNDNHDEFWGEAFFLVPYDNPDLCAEIYAGRFPVSSVQEAAALIDKVIGYETTCDKSYADRVLFLAEVLFPKDWTEAQLYELISSNGADDAEFIYGAYLNGLGLDVVRMYQTEALYPGSVNENRDNAVDSLNAGFDQVCHIGHGFRFTLSVGDGSIQNPDIDNLTNDCEWFNLYMLNCTAAAFHFDCLAERALANPVGGAVSAVGSNDSAFPNAATNYMNEYYRLLYDEDVTHVGDVFARSRLPRTPIAQAGDNVDLWTHYIYTLLGDPLLQMHTGVQEPLTVIHVTNIDFGQNNILINVTADGAPKDSAQVCLSKDDEDYVIATTNSLGNATVDFTAETPGSISVVVTGLNCIRSTTYITVDPSVDAYIAYGGVTVDDDAMGGTFGNDNGTVDAGETVDFIIDLTNTGGAASDSAWVILRCTDPLVTVLDSVAAVGVVGVSSTESALDPVRVTFDAGLADEDVVEFSLEIHDASAGSWNDTFEQLVSAPELVLIELRLDDSVVGNNNGVIEEGESFELFYKIKNFGTGTGSGLTAKLHDLSGNFTLTDTMDAYVDVTPFTLQENTSGFEIAENDTSMENDLRITITDLFGHTFDDTIELRTPEPPDSLRFDASLGPDRIEVSFDQSPSPDVTHYNVYQSLTEGGPYTRANVDPIDHAVYLSTGLTGSTTYYYVATAVDASGNESAASPEWSASTNPPLMSGFPILLSTTDPSSPAVGDLDADGDKEIVVGNEHVYAWDHLGFELKDGDSDPQTWGVLNTCGDRFSSAVALAPIDATPGLEIVAASRATNEIFVFDYNGNTLPGWPRTVGNEVRAAPSCGDIDGDGELEIVVVDNKGKVYAWHGDGNEVFDGDQNPGTDGVLFHMQPNSTTLYADAALCDLDGDGKENIIVGSFADSLWCLDDSGDVAPGFPIYIAGDIASNPVTGDIDGDGVPEIVTHSKGGNMYVVKPDGSIMSGWPRWHTTGGTNNPFFKPSPALADLDGDGKLEIIFIGRSSGETMIHILDYAGNAFPGWPVTILTKSDEWTESNPVIADVDGDMSLDIIVGDELGIIRGFDINGNSVPGFPIKIEDAVRATPLLDDVDQDGDIDMVVHGWDKKVYVYDFPAPFDYTRAPWPMYQANLLNSGRPGLVITTGIGQATFTFTVADGSINLAWRLASTGDERFDIWRAPVTDGLPEGYRVVSAGQSTLPDGTLRYVDREIEMGRTYSYRLVSEKDPNDVFITRPIYVPVTRAELAQNYPNPFNPVTRIVYYVPDGAQKTVSLVVYDVRGARVRTLVNGVKRAGRYEIEWDGRNEAGAQVSSGVYFYRIVQHGFTDTKKMILLK